MHKSFLECSRSCLFLLVCLFACGIGLGPPSARGQTSITGSEVECEDGTADEYPCENVDLLSHLSIDAIGGDSGVSLNDVWGWTDPEDLTEYALVGRTDGIAFVDVSTPTDPVYVGELPSHSGSSTWRDVKVYDGHAFIVSEASGHGTQVFDLSQLGDVPPEDQPKTFTETAHYDEVGAAHNIVMNRETGFAYIVGGNGSGTTCGGGLHMVDVQTPTDPVFAGCFTDATYGYTHDAQCVTYEGPDTEHQGDEICLNANEDALNIANVTDKDAPATIVNATYPLIGYVHQAWLTENHEYLYVDDELDELQGLVDQTRTLVFDVTDLENPELVTSFSGSTGAIDHNQYIEDGYSYQANYQSGLRILNVSNPEAPAEVGYFDTYPDGNQASFDGAWSTYPFFGSNMVLISSIGEGLFVVEPQLNQTEPTIVRFSSNSTAVAEDAGPDTLTVTLTETDPTASIEVDVAFNESASGAEADDLDDYTTQTVSFPASASTGDPRSVVVDLTDDADGEGTEVAQFDLTNLSTSGNAEIGGPSQAALSIVGDDWTVAEAREKLRDGAREVVILEGTVSRAYGSYARLQDESGPTGASAVVVRQTVGPLSGDFQQDVQEGTIQPGTELRARGKLSAPGGQIQFDNDDLARYVVQGQGEPPAPQEVSLGELVGSEEDYESELVEVEGLSFPDVEGDSSFAAETSYTVTDGEETFAFWVGTEEESALVGEPIPTGGFTFADVVGQPGDTGDGNYRLIGLQSSTALPVEMAGIDAVQTGRSVELTWKTASETNNAGFHVQHQSESGWATLGFVESKASAGTASDPDGVRDYRYRVQRELEPGTHRFRLKQEDLDGSTNLSETVAVEVGMDEAVRLTTPVPSPASSHTTVSFGVKESTETSVVLYNVLGQRVRTLYEGTPQGGQTQPIDISVETLPSGVYFVRLHADGRTRAERLTVVQ